MHTRINPETSALLISTDSEIIEDITTCGELELVNHKDVFAYPFGLYHEKTLSTLQNIGVNLAFTTKPGFNTVETNPFQSAFHERTKDEGRRTKEEGLQYSLFIC